MTAQTSLATEAPLRLDDTQELQLFWAPMMASYAQGTTVLPPWLGLRPERYQVLSEQLQLLQLLPPEAAAQHQQPMRLMRQELLELRGKECQELWDLLHNAANPDARYAAEAATVIACGCVGNRHLWHDLGLPERPRLSQMFRWYFPALFIGNNRNMRWKRFLYKQLCELGGDYLCRAPSCSQCSSYQECFGPEV